MCVCFTSSALLLFSGLAMLGVITIHEYYYSDINAVEFRGHIHWILLLLSK